MPNADTLEHPKKERLKRSIKEEMSEGCWGNTRRNLLTRITSLHREEGGLKLI